MKKPDATTSLVFKLVLWQVLATVVLSVSLYFLFDQRTALSAFFGGLVCAIANLFFVGRLYFAREEVTAQSMVYRFYRSESMKVIFTLAMFVLFIVIAKVAILPFVIAYLIAAVLVNWLFLLAT